MLALFSTADNNASSLDKRVLPFFSEITGSSAKKDPFRRVIYSKSRLARMGISTEAGELEKQIRQLHREFVNHEKTGCSNKRPYHKWNIQQHTVRFLELFDELIHNKGLFSTRNPRIDTEGSVSLAKEMLKHDSIDGRSKLELLYYAMAYHDLGKFFPFINADKNGKTHHSDHSLRLAHPGHEHLSATLLSNPRLPFKQEFKDLGLSSAQVKYIKTMIALHYRLGDLRYQIRDNYNLDFVHSSDFDEILESHLDKKSNKRYKLEIALMFLLDTLAKLPIPSREVLDFNEALKNEKLNVSGIEAWLNETGESESVAPAYLSMPISVVIAKKALDYALDWGEAEAFVEEPREEPVLT